MVSKIFVILMQLKRVIENSPLKAFFSKKKKNSPQTMLLNPSKTQPLKMLTLKNDYIVLKALKLFTIIYSCKILNVYIVDVRKNIVIYTDIDL